ncbi:MAG: helix-turn-helix transcriptional regulator [Granulosicoccaceae bacterium]
MEEALIEAAYASLDQQQITPLTDQLKALTGHPRTVYCEYNVGDTQPHRFITTGIGADEYAAYFEHYHKENLWLKARMAETSQSCFFMGSNAVNDPTLKRSTWYNEFMKPRDMADMVSFGCREVDGKHSYLNLLSSTNQPEFSEQSIKLMKAATPHINKVLQMRRRFMDKSLQAMFYSEACSSRQQAHILLDISGRVLLSTATAEDLLNLDDGFTLRGDRLAFENPVTEQTFELSVNQTKRAISLDSDMALPMRVPRKSGSGAYVFDFCPWSVQDKDMLPTATYILLTVFVPNGRIGLREELIQAAYKLTPSETRLAVDLVDGIELKAISEMRQLSLATLRNHLKSIYAKTGIHRQGELVSDMARFLAE